MVGGFALNYALLFGFFIFFGLGVSRGNSVKAVWNMAVQGAMSSMVVVRILLLLGCLTALWRSSGTIAFFVFWGIELSTPQTFILIAFLLPALLCLTFGSSFGVSGTAGVILMAIAQSGGANLVMTAGAALSGAYFGERLSPASSVLSLTANACGADLATSQRMMWKSTYIPLALTLIFYGVLSANNPIASVDPEIPNALASSFALSPLLALPAIVLLVLPWFHIKAFWTIVASCVTTAALAIFLQGATLLDILHDCVFGFSFDHPILGSIMQGGGLLSMTSIITIVLLSTAYCGIFSATHMLDGVKHQIEKLAEKIGLFPVLCLMGLGTPALFCNQSVSIVMSVEMTKELYHKQGFTPEDQAVHVGNSVINLSGLVPWAISCSVPLANMGADIASLPYSIYLYLVPICFGLSKASKLPSPTK